MEIKFKKIHNDAIKPQFGSKCAAGADLYSMTDIKIKSGETVKINTGIVAAIPDGYFGGIFARSGLATKQGLRPANAVGVIDSDYRGEIIVALHNDSQEDRVVRKRDRIAQLVIIPYAQVEFKEVDRLSSTDRGEDGFGSTGINEFSICGLNTNN